MWYITGGRRVLRETDQQRDIRFPVRPWHRPLLHAVGATAREDLVGRGLHPGDGLAHLNDVVQTVRVGGAQAGQHLKDGSELRVEGRWRFDPLGG